MNTVIPESYSDHSESNSYKAAPRGKPDFYWISAPRLQHAGASFAGMTVKLD